MRRLIVTLLSVFLAFVILFISITQTAQVRYSFNEKLTGSSKVLGDAVNVKYYFPFPGRIAPDHPLWSLKALRDKVWLVVTPKAERRAELNLLFANKRIVSAKSLFEGGKPELAFSVLTKAEKYLEDSLMEEEKAREAGVDTKSFLNELCLASLKHREVIKEILTLAPDDAKPGIIKLEESPFNVYDQTENILQGLGMTAPSDPFLEN